ncbi:hypothetical protein K2173_025169 [Erythroxylum novogranatense]|uniref:Ethylene insensitive 3-like DNA-binding domain-containing protein n=1 Tax=Erythroxylum novogranatense TaxID=1862640 RepID=A0AAV8SVL9_9ROSI|nr:hypothetical protein K2173_025169 [Erythroxylum novogranatense]
MGILEELDFCGNFRISSAPMFEGDFSLDHEPGPEIEETYGDEDMDIDELQRQMWRDRLLLIRLKDQNNRKEGVNNAKQRQSHEQALRKKMSRAHDGILKYMLKMVEVCKAQGFVYGIIPEKGKPVTGASDNLRAWWKEKVRFDRNGPAAVAKYQADHSVTEKYQDSFLPVCTGESGSFIIGDPSDYNVEGGDDELNFDMDSKPFSISYVGVRSVIGPNDRLMGTRQKDGLVGRRLAASIKQESFETNVDGIKRKKQTTSENAMLEHKLYTCGFQQCPFNDYQLGFLDRTARNNHQLNCRYRTDASQGHAMPNLQSSVENPGLFSRPLCDLATRPMKQTYASMMDLSRLGLPEDGERMISDLMSSYSNTSVQQDKNLTPGVITLFGDQNQHKERLQEFQQLDDCFYSQGVTIEGFSNMSMKSSFFPSTDIQSDQFKTFNPVFDSNINGSVDDFSFGSPLNVASIDCSMDPVPNFDVSMLYL